ncbi:hypothetical protein BDV10DRAFT_189573 [Aspergillus recurvatus]
MFLIVLLLLPLALTSPHLFPFLSPIFSLFRSFYSSIPGAIRGLLRNGIRFFANLLYCIKKCRARLLKACKKPSGAKPLNNTIAIVAALIPKPVKAHANWAFKAMWELPLWEPSKDLVKKALGDNMGTWFLCLWLFRYFRLALHLGGALRVYRAAVVPKRPNIRPVDCTVILPTADPLNNLDFEECLVSCLVNEPGVILIVTNSSAMAERVKYTVAPYAHRFPYTKISVKSCHNATANKRQQIAYGLGYVRTQIAVLLDEHVFWPSPRFLSTLLAPFEDPKANVGLVGTNKRVRRSETGFSLRSFWNMLGALCLERQNFEIRSSNALDAGVYTLSWLTSAHRSSIVTDHRFLHEFANERFFFDKFSADDGDIDTFINRWNVKNGYHVKIQHCANACIETTVDSTVSGLLSQVVTQARCTWRNNIAALFTDRIAFDQPLSIYMVYLTWFVNFTLFYDVALVYTLAHSNLATPQNHMVRDLIRWMLFCKLVKLAPYFFREPQDLLMLPGYFVFTYVESLVKIYSGLTFWVSSTGSQRTDRVSSSNSSRSRPNPTAVPGRPHQSPLAPASAVFAEPERGLPTHGQSVHVDTTQVDAGYAYESHADRLARAVREDAPSPVSPVAAAPAKKPRGRPKLTPGIESEQLKTPRSSPAQKSGTFGSPGKRGRGRPRKNAT